MCTFIGIESLAANALIEILQNTNRREVDFETLVKYGMKIVKLLLEQTGDEAKYRFIFPKKSKKQVST